MRRKWLWAGGAAGGPALKRLLTYCALETAFPEGLSCLASHFLCLIFLPPHHSARANTTLLAHQTWLQRPKSRGVSVCSTVVVVGEKEGLPRSALSNGRCEAERLSRSGASSVT